MDNSHTHRRSARSASKLPIVGFTAVGFIAVTASIGCRQAASIPPGGSIGAFGSAAPMATGQPPSALSIPSLNGNPRVTPPTSASLGVPGVTQPASPGNYLAPAPIGTFQNNSGVPASSTLPSTNSFGATAPPPIGSPSLGSQFNMNQYGSIPMGNALARAQSAMPPSQTGNPTGVSPTNQVSPMPSTEPIGQSISRSTATPIGSGIRQTGFVGDNSLQWRNPAN